MAIKLRLKSGTSSDDTLDGTDQQFDGNDANNDTNTAGGGKDHAFGGRGKDALVGGPGTDTFLIQGTGVSQFSGTAQPENDDPVRGDGHQGGDEHEAKRAPSHIVVVCPSA